MTLPLVTMDSDPDSNVGFLSFLTNVVNAFGRPPHMPYLVKIIVLSGKERYAVYYLTTIESVFNGELIIVVVL